MGKVIYLLFGPSSGLRTALRKAMVPVEGYTRRTGAVAPYYQRRAEARRARLAEEGVVDLGPDRDLAQLTNTELRLELAEAEAEAARTWKGSFLKKDRVQRILDELVRRGAY